MCVCVCDATATASFDYKWNVTINSYGVRMNAKDDDDMAQSVKRAANLSVLSHSDKRMWGE